MIELIRRDQTILAIVVRGSFAQPGVNFVTPNELSQQLAFMKHPKGKRITPHVHLPVSRAVEYTQEVLYIQRGVLRVDLFDENREYLESRVLRAEDAIVLLRGGHGFEVLEDLEMVEVKQGPFVGDLDKQRFEPAPFAPKIP